ncbi:MAG: NYN domain-containing protein [Pirellulaceae bacterium]|nr:NYN domain-containing protein [Pirellulaceae bacterium]
MPTIIDGYNLLRTCGFVSARVGPGTLERARGMLLGFLAQVFPPEERGDVTVVFDSAVRLPNMSDYILQNGIHVYYATGHRDADELIIDMLQRHSAPKSLMIVSSDHQIQKAAERRRARYCDSDRWYEDMIAANRRNPHVTATAAQIQLEIQLLQKELSVSSSDPEQEHLLAEFSKSIAAFLPQPEAVPEPEPPPVLDLATKPASTELRHGNLNDEVVAEAIQILDEDYLGVTLGKELKPQPRKVATPRRVAKIAEPLKPHLVSDTPSERVAKDDLGALPNDAAGSIAGVVDATTRVDEPTSSPSDSNPDSPTTEVPAQQLDRWNRQLKETDVTIFPPGYGEDVIFSDSFEIDDRLKKKRRT